MIVHVVPNATNNVTRFFFHFINENRNETFVVCGFLKVSTGK